MRHGGVPRGGVKPAWVLGGFLAPWLCAAAVVLPKINGPVILPDEFGYWAHAARAAGMDWTRVAVTHSWYSFGYGVLLSPLMALVPDPVALYRCAVGANLLLAGLSALPLCGVLARVFPGRGGRLAAFLAGGSVLYVSCATYAQTTMAESLLAFLYVLLAWGVARWFEAPSPGRGLLVVLAAGYMYMVHMRTVGVVLATALCAVAAGALRGRHTRGGPRVWLRAALLAAGLGALVLLTGCVRGWLVDAAAPASEGYRAMADVNGYAGQWGKVAALLSPEGLRDFLAGLAGKLLYLGCASFGLYYWGVSFLLCRVAGLLGSLRGNLRGGAGGGAPLGGVAEGGGAPPADGAMDAGVYVRGMLCLWLLLSHVSALLVTNIGTLGSDRLDGVLYGRYHENTLPPVLALGVAELLGRPAVRARLLWLLGLLGACFFAVYALVGAGGVRYMNLHSVTGIMYASALGDRYGARVILYAYLGGAVGGAAVLAAFRYGGRGWRRALLLVPCLLQLGLSCYNAVTYILPAHGAQEGDVALLLAAGRLLEGEGVREVPYLYDGGGTQVYLAQYVLRDVSLGPVLWGDASGMEAEFLLVQKGGGGTPPGLPEGYSVVAESPRYGLYRYAGSMPLRGSSGESVPPIMPGPDGTGRKRELDGNRNRTGTESYGNRNWRSRE